MMLEEESGGKLGLLLNESVVVLVKIGLFLAFALVVEKGEKGEEFGKRFEGSLTKVTSLGLKHVHEFPMIDDPSTLENL
ncbi:hypothetical protein SLA2020_272220 [Shorea laevis]